MNETGAANDTKALLERGIELWNAHDRDGWVGLFDERAELEAPGGLRVSGRAGAEQFYDTWNEAFPDSAIQDALVFGTGSQGAEEATFGGTHTGTLRSPGGDIPATGKSVRSRYAAVSRVEDGRIMSFHMYFDLVDVLVSSGSCPDETAELFAPAAPTRRQPPGAAVRVTRACWSGAGRERLCVMMAVCRWLRSVSRCLAARSEGTESLDHQGIRLTPARGMPAYRRDEVAPVKRLEHSSQRSPHDASSTPARIRRGRRVRRVAVRLKPVTEPANALTTQDGAIG